MPGGIPEDQWSQLLAQTDQWLASMRAIAPILGEFHAILREGGVPPPVAEAMVLGVAQQWFIPAVGDH